MPARLAGEVTRSARPIVSWEFVRGRERVSCRIDREPGSTAFAVVVVPYRNLRRVTVESFQAAAAAFRHHASLAADLRATGWTLVGYTS